MTNIFEKIQSCRVSLQNMNLKKSGKNTFAKYDYFELGDFLPAINQLFQDNKLFSQVTFTNEMATLTIINSEKPDEKVEFTSPMAEATLKGTHAIQNAGAVITYQRRYLYQLALEIVEADSLDATTGNSNAPQSTPKSPASDKQKNLIKIKVEQIAKKQGKSTADIAKELKIPNPSNISSSDASKIIEKLNTL